MNERFLGEAKTSREQILDRFLKGTLTATIGAVIYKACPPNIIVHVLEACAIIGTAYYYGSAIDIWEKKVHRGR